MIQILSQINFFWNLIEDGTRLPKMANEIIAIPTLILATESVALKNCTTTPYAQRSCQAEEPARGKKLTACEQIKCEVDLGAAFVFTTSPQIVQRLTSPKPQHLTLPSPVQMYCIVLSLSPSLFGCPFPCTSPFVVNLQIPRQWSDECAQIVGDICRPWFFFHKKRYIWNSGKLHLKLCIARSHPMFLTLFIVRDLTTAKD